MSTTVAAPLERVWTHRSARAARRPCSAPAPASRRRVSPGTARTARAASCAAHPLEQIRVSWHPHEDGPLSIVDLQLKREGDGTRLDIFHEGRGIAEDGLGDKDRWDEALGRLTTALNG